MLRLIEAADGHLARVRLPGGFVTAGQLRVLARLAAEMGDGRIELTSRGNIQLRALATGAATRLTDELAHAGLLPSLDHDRVRNVLASPLAGLDQGPDLAPVVAALDAGLCARPRLAGLSGRFLFAIDDGRGDVAGLGADVVAVVREGAASVNGLAVTGLAVNGLAVNGLAIRPDDVAAVMLAFAEAFLDERAAQSTAAPADGSLQGSTAQGSNSAQGSTAQGSTAQGGNSAQGGTAWRIADLPGGAGRVRALVAERFGLAAPPVPGASATSPPQDTTRSQDTTPSQGTTRSQDTTPAQNTGAPQATSPARPVGIIASLAGADGSEGGELVLDGGAPAVVLLAPLGRLTLAQVGWLADHAGGRAARVTPWRSVVLPDQADAAGVLREARQLGFGVDASSPWLRVSACAGQPGCASALADVQADARSLAARWPGRIVHVSGCARRCGRPAATEIDVTATSEGYQVAGA